MNRIFFDVHTYIQESNNIESNVVNYQYWGHWAVGPNSVYMFTIRDF